MENTNKLILGEVMIRKDKNNNTTDTIKDYETKCYKNSFSYITAFPQLHIHIQFLPQARWGSYYQDKERMKYKIWEIPSLRTFHGSSTCIKYTTES